MTRRLEAGPLLVSLGALLLLVSLFLHWFTGDITAWAAFEVWDLVLFVLALGAFAAGLGIGAPDTAVLDRGWLPAGVAAVAVIVASQIIDPPPAAAGQDADTGAWLALGSALVMCVGAVLTFGRVHLAVTVEGREPRQHVSAVDARGPADPTTDSHEAVPAQHAGSRLFSRGRTAERDADAEKAEPETGDPTVPAAGDQPPGAKQG
jgi:hypothetical protein